MSENMKIYTVSGTKQGAGTSKENRNSCPQGRYILGLGKIDK